jgi:hypothetical protein
VKPHSIRRHLCRARLRLERHEIAMYTVFVSRLN